ncbi:MAG: hypothetical protein ABI683_08585 [Ginsengibacter sp.]
MQNRLPKGSLLVAGLAAFAYYKYSKMSPDEKKNIVGSFKAKGKKLYDEYAPPELKKLFEKDRPGYEAELIQQDEAYK